MGLLGDDLWSDRGGYMRDFGLHRALLTSRVEFGVLLGILLRLEGLLLVLLLLLLVAHDDRRRVALLASRCLHRGVLIGAIVLLVGGLRVTAL